MSNKEIFKLFPERVLEDSEQTLLTAEGESGEGAPQVYGVSDLLDAIQARLDLDFFRVWVRGEVSSLSSPSSGHVYFTLKDERAQVRAVLFRSQAQRLPFKLQEGQEVLCLGRLNIYASRGDLQLIVETVEPVGEGALRLAFEQLKARLEEEGLFDETHKKDLPVFPRRVFLVTSPTGAAVRDFIRTARARFRGVRMVLCPVKVQGEDAPWEIISALDMIELVAGEGDVVVLTRGGGSLEDLWAFNHEGLARRIFDFPHPLVSAVGHEIDFTIADFVADVRAATPTAAAQIVLPDRKGLLEQLSGLEKRLGLVVSALLSSARQKVQSLHVRLADPRRRLVERRLRVDDLTSQIRSSISRLISKQRLRHAGVEQGLMQRNPLSLVQLAQKDLEEKNRRLAKASDIFVERRRSRLGALAASLDAVSPLSVLSRGYSLAYNTVTREIIRSADQVVPGDRITVKPSKGLVHCEVKEVETTYKKI